MHMKFSVHVRSHWNADRKIKSNEPFLKHDQQTFQFVYFQYRL